MSKEEVYDTQINPLMSQIIAICKEHKIPILATFTLDLDSGLQCTTSLLESDWEPADAMLEAARVLMSSRSPMMLTVRGGDGKIKSIEAIV